MFGLLKMLFYTCVAVVVGVFIGTVPVGGRTMADRIASAYRDLPTLHQAEPAKPARRERVAPATKAGARTARAAPVAVAAASTAPVTAGAANTPDAHTPEQRAALERLIANRAKR